MSKYGDVKITQLRRSCDLAKTILEIFPPDQLEAFAEDGICPHYCVVNPKTGQEMFKLFHSVEINDWIHSEIVHYKKGLTEPVKIYLNNVDPSEFYPQNIEDVPEELRGISGLMQVPVHHAMEMPGVYFLCKEKSIVYIGKSINVFHRLVAHRIKQE